MTGVFVIQEDGSLIAMTEQPYDSEDVLQFLLAQYPDLLAGDQMDPTEPRRLLLISRETPIPVEEGGGWQFSCDHLFVDQDGVPTLVEVKRASDTRIRREVVAQMLDYAANANAYGPVTPLAVQFENRCAADGLDPEEEIRERLGPGVDPVDLWERTSTNLSAGRMRLVFVADYIPPELRRIVEYLNLQMRETDVAAVEIKQYAGGGLKTLVPKVIGLTEMKRVSTPARVAHVWDESSFFTALKEKHSAGVPAARRIFDWAKTNMPESTWGSGENGSYNIGMWHNGRWYAPMSMWVYGSLNVQFEYLADKPPFDREEMRLELLRRVNETPGIYLDPSTAGEKPRRPRILLGELEQDAAVDNILDVLEWFVGVLRDQA